MATDSAVDGDGAASATMFSSARPFSDADWARINEWLDAVYADFTEKVASGRRMDIGRVHELARGRVWTGADAVANGLADETGGMREAIAIARQRAGLPDDAPVRVYPRLGPLDQLRPAESSEARPAARRSARRGRRRGAVRRRLGPGLAVRGGGGPAAVRTARPPRGMENQLISNGPLMTPPGNDFPSALSAWAAGVTLVTIADDRDDIGATVSAFMPVSLDPPLVLVSLIAGSYPAEVLSRPSLPAAQFAVTLLASSQKLLAGQFAAAGRPSARRILDDAPHTRGAESGALIPLGGLAALECSVARRVPGRRPPAGHLRGRRRSRTWPRTATR